MGIRATLYLLESRLEDCRLIYSQKGKGKMKKKIKCKICGKTISHKNSHNGEPVVKGRVCEICNDEIVIKARLEQPQTKLEAMFEDGHIDTKGNY